MCYNSFMLFNEMQVGEFTKSDVVTAQVAQTIRAKAVQKGTSLLREVSEYLKTLNHDTSNKAGVFRKRTASEIITSCFQTGCTDRGVVFLALANELGIPAVYVETFKSDTLGAANAGMEGHVFTKVYDAQHGQWEIYEPMTGFQTSYALGKDGYTPVAIGRDHSAAYLVNEKGEPTSTPQRIDTEDALCAVARHSLPQRADGNSWSTSLGARTGRVLQ
jgi:hypothetical protein